MIVQVVPEQENAGNIVRCPMLFPCVEASASSNEARTFPVLPEVTVIVTDFPYAQSVLETSKLWQESL